MFTTKLLNNFIKSDLSFNSKKVFLNKNFTAVIWDFPIDARNMELYERKKNLISFLIPFPEQFFFNYSIYI